MYQLYRLGWHSFQQLCQTIASEVLGQTVEAYLDSHDAGKDGAFRGTWETDGGEDLEGSFVIQCKFTGRPHYNLRPSDLSEELGKIKKLVENGNCDSYILMTNAGVSGVQAQKITDQIKCEGVKHVVILDSTWINRQILENKRLRMLVPRIYGLGDLSQILDERVYDQAIAVLEFMRDDLSKVVITDAYTKSYKAIENHGFVLLIGEPASGKTTITSLLSLAALDQGGSSILKLDHPDDVVKHWNPHESSQLFWLDDAFGVTQYDESLVHRWNYVLPKFQAMINKGATIVMTSRDYIYNRAREQLKSSTFPLLKENQVVINVQGLSVQEREQVLYNHVKLGNQPRDFRTKIKPFLHNIASHPRFLPDTAWRLGNSFFTKNLYFSSYYINQFVDKREDLLQEIILNLDKDSRAALALIYTRNGKLESPMNLQPPERIMLENLGSSHGECASAIEALSGSLTRYYSENGRSFWLFRHPTVGDAYGAILFQKQEQLEIFLQGVDLENFSRLVTCGNLDIENAVVVPNSLFPLIMKKLDDMKETQPEGYEHIFGFEAKKKTLFYFLANRCSREFLSLYLEHNRDLLNEVSRPGLYLDAVPEVPLAIRLHELGLLPNEKRKTFVASVSDHALNSSDASALTNKGIRSLFTEQEYAELIDRLKIELLPRLEDERRMWEEDFDLDENLSPDEHMNMFLNFLNALLETFGNSQNVARQIEHEMDLVSEWIYNSEWVDSDSEEPDSSLWQPMDIRPSGDTESERSIFDDIDVEV